LHSKIIMVRDFIIIIVNNANVSNSNMYGFIDYENILFYL